MPRLVRVNLPQHQALNELVVGLSRPPRSLTYPPGVYLRALRARMRMCQAQLSRRTGVSQGDISRIERGKVDPRLGTLRRLFDGLFCDLLLLPRARKRPTDALGEIEAARPDYGHERCPWKGQNILK